MCTRTLRLIIASLVLALGLSGCASWLADDSRDLQVHLVDVKMVKARLTHQRLMLHFRIDNPNDGSVTVRGLRYRVHLADILLADGEYSQLLRVDGHSSEHFNVPVRTNLWQHLRDVVKLMRHPDQPIPYRLEGELETGLVVWKDEPLRRDGKVVAGDLMRR